MYKCPDQKEKTETDSTLIRTNLKRARQLWGTNLSHALEDLLRFYSEEFGVSVNRGDLLLLQANWYVTHSGLLRLATRRHCSGINVTAVPELCDASCSRWAFKATVYKSSKCKGFVGYGDADPSNVSSVVRGAEMRVAETRAVNRALRKAYGIGICSVEELGASPGNRPLRAERKGPCPAKPTNGNNDHHPLRERLRSLIDEHQLDAVLVKRYAADYCGAPELRLATRERVEEFVQHLAESAATDRDSLLAQLNGYAEKQAGAA
jgi:hypothetical protein